MFEETGPFSWLQIKHCWDVCGPFHPYPRWHLQHMGRCARCVTLRSSPQLWSNRTVKREKSLLPFKDSNWNGLLPEKYSSLFRGKVENRAKVRTCLRSKISNPDHQLKWINPPCQNWVFWGSNFGTRIYTYYTNSRSELITISQKPALETICGESSNPWHTDVSAEAVPVYSL